MKWNPPHFAHKFYPCATRLNVLIYFKQERKQEVILQLAKKLKPGGLLVLGHGEVINFECEELTRVNNKHCLAFLSNDEDN